METGFLLICSAGNDSRSIMDDGYFTMRLFEVNEVDDGYLTVRLLEVI